MYSTTLSVTSAPDRVGDKRQATTALSSGKRPGPHRTGGCVGPMAHLDRYGKSRLHRVSIPGPPPLHLYVVITRRSMGLSLGTPK
jgi:hypothetical protein